LLLQVTPDPEITDFSAANSPVTRGDTLTLNWDVTNTQTVDILINDEVILAGLDADLGTVDINTDELSLTLTGQFQIDLRAINDDKSITRNTPVILEEPLVVEAFEVTPVTLARNVVQTLNGNWRVRGATETRIEGLSGLGPVSVETSFGPEGSFEVSGLPTEPFAVILVAEDENDNTITQSIDITLFDPVCTTTVEGMELHTLPTADSNVISTLALGQALVIGAQSADGLWLRTQREGARAWGLREELRCETSFDPANLFVDPETVPRPPETTPQVEAEATPETTPEPTR